MPRLKPTSPFSQNANSCKHPGPEVYFFTSHEMQTRGQSYKCLI